MAKKARLRKDIARGASPTPPRAKARKSPVDSRRKDIARVERYRREAKERAAARFGWALIACCMLAVGTMVALCLTGHSRQTCLSIAAAHGGVAALVLKAYFVEEADAHACLRALLELICANEVTPRVPGKRAPKEPGAVENENARR
jgi:hypothetical protein